MVLRPRITLARAGCSVLVFEARDRGWGGTVGGPTLPGFVHDVCSSIHPLAAISPFFRELPLHEYGLEGIYSPALRWLTRLTMGRQCSSIGR